MTVLEYGVIGSCTFVQYADIEKETGHSDDVMKLWAKIPNKTKKFAKWIEKKEAELYIVGVSCSNEKVSSALENAMRSLIGKDEYNKKKEQLGDLSSSLFVSFFEDEAQDDILKKQDECKITFDVKIKDLKKHIKKELHPLLIKEVA